MIALRAIKERSRIYNREIRRLGFRKNHPPRGPEKEEALVEAAAAFLSKFRWEKGPDGVMRAQRRL